MEFWWAVVAFLGVLLFGTLQGIVVAIVLSLVSIAAQVANPTMHVIGRKKGTDLLRPLSPVHPTDETIEGLLILRPEGRLFFVNCQQVADQMRSAISTYNPQVVVIDLSSVIDVEYSAFQMLVEGNKRLATQGGRLWLAGLSPTVLEYMRTSGFVKELGESALFHSAEAAVQSYMKFRENTP